MRPDLILQFAMSIGCGGSSAPAPNPKQAQAELRPVTVQDVPASESLGTAVLVPFDSIDTLDEIPEVVH